VNGTQQGRDAVTALEKVMLADTEFRVSGYPQFLNPNRMLPGLGYVKSHFVLSLRSSGLHLLFRLICSFLGLNERPITDICAMPKRTPYC
jgi:hypothetical protein